MAIVQVANTGIPQVMSGPRAVFMVDGKTIAYAGNVTGEETIDYEPVNCLDLLEVKEHVPVAYRATLTAQIFRVVGNSLKAQGIFPVLSKIITSQGMTAALTNGVPVDGGSDDRKIAFYTGVRAASHTWDVGARGLVSDNVNFVAIKVEDESEQL